MRALSCWIIFTAAFPCDLKQGLANTVELRHFRSLSGFGLFALRLWMGDVLDYCDFLRSSSGCGFAGSSRPTMIIVFSMFHFLSAATAYRGLRATGWAAFWGWNWLASGRVILFDPHGSPVPGLWDSEFGCLLT